MKAIPNAWKRISVSFTVGQFHNNRLVVFFVKYSTNTNGTEEQVASKQ